jgi:Glycosyl transferase family 90
MEELLEPWVHYIPMLPDGSNAEEIVQWALDNEKEARRIAERATLFMYDLVYHPDAASDDRKIQEEMARRYRTLWH